MHYKGIYKMKELNTKETLVGSRKAIRNWMEKLINDFKPLKLHFIFINFTEEEMEVLDTIIK